MRVVCVATCPAYKHHMLDSPAIMTRASHALFMPKPNNQLEKPRGNAILKEIQNSLLEVKSAH